MTHHSDSTAAETLSQTYSDLLEITNLAQTLQRSVKCRDLEGELQPDQMLIERLVQSIDELTEKLGREI